eukprot:2022728-Prymnesium_polylepis.1
MSKKNQIKDDLAHIPRRNQPKRIALAGELKTWEAEIKRRQKALRSLEQSLLDLEDKPYSARAARRSASPPAHAPASRCARHAP